jgi:hypothetical protein
MFVTDHPLAPSLHEVATGIESHPLPPVRATSENVSPSKAPTKRAAPAVLAQPPNCPTDAC